MRAPAVLAAVLATAVLIMGAVSRQPANPHYDPSKPHHTPTGFRNPRQLEQRGAADLVRWRLDRLTSAATPPPAMDLSPAAPELAFLRENRHQTAVTWIGHATLLVQTAGVNLLTDPHFSERASPLPFLGPRRFQPPGVTLKDLPHIDVVLISHSHYDHLDLESVSRLQAQPGGPPLFLVPLGLDGWFLDNVPGATAANVRRLDWWDSADAAGLEVTFVPAQHWSSRTPWDRNTTLWGGWVARSPSFRFYFAGDLGYSQDPRDIGERFGGFDLAAIPIGAYEPRWFMRPQHVNPAEAVQVHRDARVRRSIGIHWGTFQGLTDEPIDQAVTDLAAARQAAGLTPDDFLTLRHGQTLRVAE